jgi:hypothetical protein
MTAPSPLARKLGVKPGHRVLVLGAPEGFTLDPLPDGVTVSTALPGDAAAPGRERAPVVLAFVRDSAAVEAAVPVASAAVADRGLLWFAYPKGGKKAGTDLGRDILWRQLGEHGLAGVNLVAVDETWSAMRARPEAEVGT